MVVVMLVFEFAEIQWYCWVATEWWQKAGWGKGCLRWWCGMVMVRGLGVVEGGSSKKRSEWR